MHYINYPLSFSLKGCLCTAVPKQDVEDNRLMDVTRLLLEPEATTDREESLSRYGKPFEL